jgi:hypothetical protein
MNKYIFIIVILLYGCGVPPTFYKVETNVPLKYIKDISNSSHNGKATFFIFNKQQNEEICTVYENTNDLYKIFFNDYTQKYGLSGITNQIEDTGYDTIEDIINKYHLKKSTTYKIGNRCSGFSNLSHYYYEIYKGNQKNFYIEFTNDISVYNAAKQIKLAQFKQEQDKTKQATLYTKTVLPNQKLYGAKYIQGLIWQDQAINILHNVMDANEAKNYCKNLRLLNIDSWRLPTLNEMKKLHSNVHQLRYISKNNNYLTSDTGCSNNLCGTFYIDINRNKPFISTTTYKGSVRCVSDAKQYAIQKISSQHSYNYLEKMYPAQYYDIIKLISGNTLIASSEFLCSNNTGQICTKIALLYKDYKAIVINQTQKEIIIKKWGWFAIDFIDAGLHMGIIAVPTTIDKYPFPKLVSINESGTLMHITNPKENIGFDIQIKQGIEKKYLLNAKNNHYKTYNSSKSLTIGQLIANKIVHKIGKPAINNKQNLDMQQSCLAQTKYGSNFCYGIKDKDLQQSCLAQTKYGSNFCYGIRK